jgi:RimJ/RimL family protein N-acetyltransferase
LPHSPDDGDRQELVTERLLLRPFVAEDFEAFAAITGDAEVMRYIRAGALTREAAWWQLAKYLGHWQLRGYGLWAVVERAGGRVIGHLGYLDPDGGHGFEMGWALARSAWGKGYAFEGARAAIDHAFTVLDREHIVCLIHPENARSIRLAARLGAVPEGEVHDGGMSLQVFGLHRPGAVP